MPHMPAPHMTVVAKTATAPKWPPSAQEEPASPAPEVVPTPIQADPVAGTLSEWDVDIGSIPPSVARQLFGGSKGKDQKETATATAEPISLATAEPISLHMMQHIKLDSTPCTSETPSARFADVPSPLRRRESATTASLPTLPRPHTTEAQPEQMRQKASIRSTTPSAPVVSRRVSDNNQINSSIQSWTPPSLQVRNESSTEANATPMGSSVRDRIRQLELSARRNLVQN